jgi:arylsulfatase A-like enzyme
LKAEHGEVTPNLDALAREGVSFLLALAHAPTTLSSHASAFTGVDGHGHAIPHNGTVLPDSAETVAERLAAAGYDTIGIVGASVIAKNTGIAQGFRIWDDTLPVDRGRRHEDIAASVTSRALAALARRDPDKPLLLFVHYFDAHAPYAAPGDWSRRFSIPGYSGEFDGSRTAMKRAVAQSRAGVLPAADLEEARARYLGEVGYVDEQLGRLLRELDAAGISKASRDVVVFGDHGEGLGEDPLNPFGHGGDVDLWAVRVPLVVRGPAVPAGLVVSRQVRVMDVGPTVLGLAGLPTALGEGEDLAPVWTAAAGWTGDIPVDKPGSADIPTPAPPSFAEASQPEEEANRDGWPNLPFERAVYQHGFACLRYPLTRRPEAVYQVSGGTLRGEGVAPFDDSLCPLLDAWDAKAPAPAPPLTDAETDEALRALGYRE